ncbi:MAG: Cobalt-zinc-cadmium resistance protein [Candidatus Rifleibacterium amylolyticum]|nr:MAG: Cobalt-zinc-cadmium resistance protein [Candidatus Rifleibacterium amylolyticum]NLF98412.1 cation transporter [Candidatus Riflebacteria bacterium]
MTISIEQQNSETRRVTLAGLIINLFLTVIKIVAGIYGNSQSVIADGIHSLSDSATDIAVLVGLKYWNEPPDLCHPYGHRRIETMVTVVIGIALALAGIFLGSEAVEKFRSGGYVVPETVTLAVAIISVVVKEFLFRWTYNVGEKLKSSALKANAWHHRTDSFSSIAVALAIGMALIDPKWALLDPVAALAVGAFILQAAWKIATPALRELADAGATAEDLKNIEKLVLEVEGVVSVHALRSRFHGAGLQVDLHIQVDGGLSVREGHVISGKAKRRLIEDGPDIVDVLVHIEPAD